MRFFLFILFFSLNVFSKIPAHSFKEKHFDPVVTRLLDKTSLQLTLAGALSVGLTNPNDDRIQNEWQNHQKMSEDTSHAFDHIGSGAVGVLVFGAQAFFDPDEDHYQSTGRTLFYSTVINTTLKYAFGRTRPNERDHYSFPSGHTMTSFATATSLTYAYGWKAAIISYPIAAFVGLSRLSDNAHWASDVVGGAFVGYIVARASTYEYNEDESSVSDKLRYQVIPEFSPEFTGAKFVMSF